jgi:hypothetical protein
VAPDPTTTTTVAPDPTTTTTWVLDPTTTTTKPSTKKAAASHAPGAPKNVRASVKGSTVTVSWSNRSGTLGDDVFRDGQEIAWPGWPSRVVTSFRDTKVTAGSHTYYVAAFNSRGMGIASHGVTVSVSRGHNRHEHRR